MDTFAFEHCSQFLYHADNFFYWAAGLNRLETGRQMNFLTGNRPATGSSITKPAGNRPDPSLSKQDPYRREYAH